jgi:probable O-glycosylation ligase (exosortase A-associated)
VSTPFVLYLTVVFFEYFGIGRLIPLVNALHVSLLISIGLFIYSWSQHPDVRTWLKETQSLLLLVLLCLTILSIFHAFVRLYSFNVFKVQIGYFVLFAVSLYFVADARKARVVAWLLVVVHVWLVFENKHRLFASVRIGGFEGGYFLGDGNDFGWGLNVVLPFAIFLFLSSRRVIPRFVSFAASLTIILGIIGTSSRGATIAMAAGFLYFILMGDRRLVGIFVTAAVVVGVLVLSPPAYFDRMKSVGTYSEDTSAMGRILAWRSALDMATDHPLGVGAGNFNSAYGRFYMPEDANHPRWLSVHSIYFSILGEYGFIGLVVLVSILIFNLGQNMRSAARLRRSHNPPNSPSWPTCINMSLVAFAVGGIFLGGVNYPHLYLLTALTIGAKVMSGGFEEIGETASLAESTQTSDGSSVSA